MLGDTAAYCSLMNHFLRVERVVNLGLHDVAELSRLLANLKLALIVVSGRQCKGTTLWRGDGDFWWFKGDKAR